MFLSYFVKILQDKLEVFVGFDERVVYPNLYLFVTAEAGMGKGALTLCRELITPINRQLHELTKTLDAQYKADMAEYTKGKKSENAQMPEQVCRLTPTAEDGLFSRFAFYFIPFKRGFRNVFATSDVSQSNIVDNDGNVLSDRNERYRSARICRALTEEYGLYIARKNSK